MRQLSSSSSFFAATRSLVPKPSVNQQHETSGEDDNKILFLGHAFGFALTYLF